MMLQARPELDLERSESSPCMVSTSQTFGSKTACWWGPSILRLLREFERVSQPAAERFRDVLPILTIRVIAADHS